MILLSEVTSLEATLTYSDNFQSDMFRRCTRMPLTVLKAQHMITLIISLLYYVEIEKC